MDSQSDVAHGAAVLPHASRQRSSVDPAPSSVRSPSRQVAIDVARGLAVLLMIQTHAFDGWVAPAHKSSLGYGLTRAVASIPAPLFLLLAGVGLSLGADAAADRGQADSSIRRALCLRGLGITGYGYLVSAIYAVIEGSQPTAQVLPVLLRADILHCIGLSIALCALLLVRRKDAVALAAGLTGSALLFSVVVPRVLAVPTEPGLAALAALWFDVPGYTRFPLLPLVGFCALGVIVGRFLPRLRPAESSAVRIAVVCLGFATLSWLATRGLLAALGGPLARSHPAVVPNFFDGLARALAVLALAQWLTLRASIQSMPMQALLSLGRASLFVYALHIPLCYGRVASLFSGRFSVGQAAPLVLALGLCCWGALGLRDALRRWLRRQRKNP